MMIGMKRGTVNEIGIGFGTGIRLLIGNRMEIEDWNVDLDEDTDGGWNWD